MRFFSIIKKNSSLYTTLTNVYKNLHILHMYLYPYICIYRYMPFFLTNSITVAYMEVRVCMIVCIISFLDFVMGDNNIIDSQCCKVIVIVIL